MTFDFDRIITFFVNIHFYCLFISLHYGVLGGNNFKEWPSTTSFCYIDKSKNSHKYQSLKERYRQTE